jgi:hypothetical protein
MRVESQRGRGEGTGEVMKDEDSTWTYNNFAKQLIVKIKG